MAGSSSTTAIVKEDYLECSLCLERLQKPKLLPCFHTFCQDCLLRYLDSEKADFINCPKCRKRLKLTPEDVPKLQTNFYLLPYLDSKEKQERQQCPVHPEEHVRYLCVSCGNGEEAVCCQCAVLGDHKGHELKDLAKAIEEVRSELKGKQAFLDHCCSELSCLLTSSQQYREAAELERQSVEWILRQRAQDLHGLVETMLSDSLAGVERILAPITGKDKSIETALKAATDVQKDVMAALQDGTASYRRIKDLVTEISTGPGSQAALQQAVIDHNEALQTGLPALRCDLEGQHSDHVGRLLGRVFVDRSRVCLLSQWFVVRTVFSCADKADCETPEASSNQVYALHPTDEGEVWVVYAISQDPARHVCRVARYGQTGQLESCPTTVSGRVCIAGLSHGWVRVEGKYCKALEVYNSSPILSMKKDLNNSYDVYNKSDARYLLRVYGDGRCEVRKMVILGSRDSYVCSISARNPVTLDVSRNGRILAVVEEDESSAESRVVLFRCGESLPFVVLMYHENRRLRPSDVCFFKAGPELEERLVVADSLNDVLLVIVVEDDAMYTDKAKAAHERLRSKSYSENSFWSGSYSKNGFRSESYSESASTSQGQPLDRSTKNTSSTFSRLSSEAITQTVPRSSVVTDTVPTTATNELKRATVFSRAQSCAFAGMTSDSCATETFVATADICTTGTLKVVDEVKLPGKPTALCADGEGRLWVGCQDGRILNLTPVTSFSGRSAPNKN